MVPGTSVFCAGHLVRRLAANTDQDAPACALQHWLASVFPTGPQVSPTNGRRSGLAPKLSNLNKMRQRNTQQIKEQDKCPPNQTKEEEIGPPGSQASSRGDAKDSALLSRCDRDEIIIYFNIPIHILLRTKF